MSWPACLKLSWLSNDLFPSFLAQYRTACAPLTWDTMIWPDCMKLSWLSHDLSPHFKAQYRPACARQTWTTMSCQLSCLSNDLFLNFQLNIEQPALARPELQWVDQLACSCSGKSQVAGLAQSSRVSPKGCNCKHFFGLHMFWAWYVLGLICCRDTRIMSRDDTSTVKNLNWSTKLLGSIRSGLTVLEENNLYFSGESSYCIK
jgi:hypothetical protein